MRRARRDTGGKADEKVPWASFADALTGLLFVFILMTLGFAYQLKEQEERSNAKEQEAIQRLEEYEQLLAAKRKILDALLGTSGTAGEGSSKVASCLMKADAGASSLFESIRADREEHRVALRLPGSQAWFESCEKDIDPADHERVKLVARCIDEFVESGGLESPVDGYAFRLRVLVEGHTDTGLAANCQTLQSNWELSAARAAGFVELMLKGKEGEEWEEGALLQRRIDAGMLDLVPTGLEATAPARRDICALAKAVKDPVCVCLRAHEWDYRQCYELEEGESLREKVRAWGNQLVGKKGDDYKSQNRRVGLRFEVVDRLEARAAQSPAEAAAP